MSYLKERGYYNPDVGGDRFVKYLLLFYFNLHELVEIFFCYILLYLFQIIIGIPFYFILERELDIFKDTVWNTHRIRKQKDTYLPDGIPNHIFEFPEEYGLEDCCKDCIYFTNNGLQNQLCFFSVFELLEIKIFF